MGTPGSSLQTLGENRTQLPESPIQSQAQALPHHFNFFFFSDDKNDTYQFSMDLLRKSHSKHFGVYPASVFCEYIHWQYTGYKLRYPLQIGNKIWFKTQKRKRGSTVKSLPRSLFCQAPSPLLVLLFFAIILPETVFRSESKHTHTHLCTHRCCLSPTQMVGLPNRSTCQRRDHPISVRKNCCIFNRCFSTSSSSKT